MACMRLYKLCFLSTAYSAIQQTRKKKYNQHQIWSAKIDGWHLTWRSSANMNRNTFSQHAWLCGLSDSEYDWFTLDWKVSAKEIKKKNVRVSLYIAQITVFRKLKEPSYAMATKSHGCRSHKRVVITYNKHVRNHVCVRAACSVQQ